MFCYKQLLNAFHELSSARLNISCFCKYYNSLTAETFTQNLHFSFQNFFTTSEI